MNTTPSLLAAISIPSIQTLGLWFLGAAAICLIIWGVIRLIKSTGIPIPEPVRIAFIVLAGLFLLLLLAKVFGLVS